MADKIGRPRVVNLGIIAMVLCIFLLLLKLPLTLLGLVMIIWGLGWTFNHVGLATMLTDLPVEFLNEAASLNSGVRFIAGGPSLGGALIFALLAMLFLLVACGEKPAPKLDFKNSDLTGLDFGKDFALTAGARHDGCATAIQAGGCG